MRKFVTYARKGQHFVCEVECEKVTPMQDPSVMWLPHGEFKMRILAPQDLYEKQGEGEKATPVPAVWMGWHFMDSVEEARAKCEQSIRHGMVEFAQQKHREAATEEEIQAECAKIQVVML